MIKMTRVKELHLGTKLSDLERYLVMPDVTSRKISSLMETARKLMIEAEGYNHEGDEELAYIFYMKYFNLLNSIHNKPEYPENKQTVRQILGGNSSNMVKMDKLETLSKSLVKRYEAKQNNDNIVHAKKVDAERDYDDLTASEKFDRLKAGSQVPPISPKGQINNGNMKTITPEILFDRIQDNKVLIMDCRPSADYKMSCLRYDWSLNIPEEIIAEGMSAGKIQDKLDEPSKILWSSRCIKEHVVLMDWDTKDENPPSNSPIGILLDILQNWDPDITYRSPIKILEGGFEYFIMMYPTLCTNPTVQAPRQNNNEVNIIDEIEYPSIHDITMKDEIRERGFSDGPSSKTASKPPSVDRSSKRAAIETYKTKQKVIVEIMHDQEELLEKAKMNDDKLQQALMKWDLIFSKRANSGKSEITPSEQELLYNILQLESVADDYKVENNRLREELEEYKRLEQEQKSKLTPNEVQNLEQVTKNIESKIQERQMLDEQHEREKQQRAKQLIIARENKRHLKSSPPPEDEGISKPKIPQFDRSVKPLFNTVVPTTSTAAERYRDFSPVPGTVGRGLTGLKNLGNTCYMNSILQCLSNTPHLAEYCITDKYKDYINRSNKTKGQIVEEVAALIKVLWNGNYKCVASKDLRYVVGQYQQIFRGIEQQDSHEFLTILMDWLHSDLQTLNVPGKLRDNITASEKAWMDFTKSKESLILHLFYGQIKSTVKCVICHKESATYESFSNLSFELPNNANVCYLSQCMDMYFSGELIHGWNCPNCKQKRDAIKKLDISKLPPVLVIHLKRFYADPDMIGHSYKKKQNFVRFPLENMDMTPYIARSESRAVTPKTYQLYGVSNHYGSMEGGHYTAFCKSGNYGKWFKFDDQVVTHLDTSSVVSIAAYILFYTRLPPIQINESN